MSLGLGNVHNNFSLFHGIEMICKVVRKIEVLFDQDNRHFAFLAEFVDERKDGSMKQFMFGERDADGEYTEEYHYDDADKLIADAKKILTA